MLHTLRRLILGLFLILAAASVLLLSDLGSRLGVQKDGRVARVALLQHASQSILDESREGVVAGLKGGGWEIGRNLELKLYNAEGDNAVSQTIAKEMAGGGYDLLMSISTVSLQAVANANRAGKTNHVFGVVSDPAIAGVGVSATDPLDHPAHLAGFGTMQPVAEVFRLAREMNPALASVGVVWNAAEANSEAQVKLARQVCAELGVTLMETTVDNSSGVAEAASALVARGVEAIWVGGDVTVLTGIDTVMAAAKKGRIPVFTVIPPNVKRGALFDLGADYHEVGRLAGNLAAEVLGGRSPAEVEIKNVMPEMLTVNRSVLAGLKDQWTLSDGVLARARLVIEADGSEVVRQAAAPSSRKKWKIAVVNYVESIPCEETMEGLHAAAKRSKLVEGQDYELTVRSAQGDMAALSGIFDAVLTDGADIVVPLSTPALQVAIQKIRDRPVLFSVVANPVAAGAGSSFSEHLPNVTGVSVLAPIEEALDTIERHFPGYRRIGTLFCPAEANSVDLKESMEASCRRRGIVLECVAVNSPGELPDATLALVSRPIDAIVQVSDNLSNAGFSAITRAARQAKMPLLSLNSTTVELGAAISFGRDYHNTGEVTMELIERVIGGEDPGKIPFILPPKVYFSASPANARELGMSLPQGLLDEEGIVIQ